MKIPCRHKKFDVGMNSGKEKNQDFNDLLLILAFLLSDVSYNYVHVIVVMDATNPTFSLKNL